MLSGNPLKIVGQSLIQETTPLQTSGSIYNVEKALVGGKTFYKIAISKGTTIGKFKQVGKTFITDSAPLGATVLNVDSTVGFGSTGTISFENRSLSYTSKNYTQFLGLTPLTSPCGIGSTVRSGLVATSYEDGNLNLPVTFNVLGVLHDFVGEARSQQENSVLNIKHLGKKEKELRYSTWIYNNASTYNIDSFTLQSNNNYTLSFAAQEHTLYVGDTIEVINQNDEEDVVLGKITFVFEIHLRRNPCFQKHSHI